MVRKSNQTKSDVLKRLGEAVQLFQESTDEFDDAAAQALGLNRTDLKCLGIVARHQPVSAGEIARQTKLTKGATTTAIDRAEKAGYIRRVPDPKDKRGVLLTLTPKTLKVIDKIWGPFIHNAEKDFGHYSVAELETIARFLEEARVGQLAHAERVRKLNEI
jgi:DNA-binding MarR family transcriptional regulator